MGNSHKAPRRHFMPANINERNEERKSPVRRQQHRPLIRRDEAVSLFLQNVRRRFQQPELRLEEQKGQTIPTSDAKIQVCVCITNGSLRLSTSSKGVTYLTFGYTATEPVDISFFMFSTETVNHSNDTINYSGLLYQQSFQPGSNCKFPKRKLELELDESDAWRKTNPIPIVVELVKPT